MRSRSQEIKKQAVEPRHFGPLIPIHMKIDRDSRMNSKTHICQDSQPRNTITPGFHVDIPTRLKSPESETFERARLQKAGHDANASVKSEDSWSSHLSIDTPPSISEVRPAYASGRDNRESKNGASSIIEEVGDRRLCR